jgi:hypothetical protein
MVFGEDGKRFVHQFIFPEIESIIDSDDNLELKKFVRSSTVVDKIVGSF